MHRRVSTNISVNRSLLALECGDGVTIHFQQIYNAVDRIGVTIDAVFDLHWASVREMGFF